MCTNAHIQTHSTESTLSFMDFFKIKKQNQCLCSIYYFFIFFIMKIRKTKYVIWNLHQGVTVWELPIFIPTSFPKEWNEQILNSLVSMVEAVSFLRLHKWGFKPGSLICLPACFMLLPLYQTFSTLPQSAPPI